MSRILHNAWRLTLRISCRCCILQIPSSRFCSLSTSQPLVCLQASIGHTDRPIDPMILRASTSRVLAMVALSPVAVAASAQPAGPASRHRVDKRSAAAQEVRHARQRPHPREAAPPVPSVASVSETGEPAETESVSAKPTHTKVVAEVISAMIASADAPGSSSDVELPNEPPARMSLVGIVESPTRDLRIAVLSLNDHVFYGREGDLVAGRYRLIDFSDSTARVVDPRGELTEIVPPPSSADVPTEPPTPPASSGTGSLRLLVSPGSTPVYVDGNFVGTVDDFSDTDSCLNLEVGVHRVELRAPEYESVTFDVRIDANRIATYRATLTHHPAGEL